MGVSKRGVFGKKKGFKVSKGKRNNYGLMLATARKGVLWKPKIRHGRKVERISNVDVFYFGNRNLGKGCLASMKKPDGASVK